MTFLSLLLVLALVQWWGSGAPLQRDGWFFRYADWLDNRPKLTWPAGRLLLAVLVPVLALWLLTWWVASTLAPIWVLFIAVPVLLYSLGRGDFTEQVRNYIEASYRKDSVSAALHLAQLQGKEVDDRDPEDWPTLHRQALRAIAYRGFERMFAVIFWFFILGPAGALLYRLSLLYRQREPSALVDRWVWLLEWPVVRLMGLTWAMAGNFDTCFFRCQRDSLDVHKRSSSVLYDHALGALGLPDEVCGEEPVTLDSISASQPLFSRSLLIWVCFLALVTLLA